MDFRNLDPILEQALQEDVGRGDITTDSIVEYRRKADGSSLRATAVVIAREPLILCGWPAFERVFHLLGPVDVQAELEEGSRVQEGACLGRLTGSFRDLLRGERVALNILQRLSGIATLTRLFVDLTSGTRAQILDTRKTTPLWRSLERYAVRTGGGRNHRSGLDDAVLIKENHIAVAGGINEAVEACRQGVHHLHRIEVEVRDLAELAEALESGAEVVMLDNMTPGQVKEAVQNVDGRCKLEVSGGITLDTVRSYAETGVDFLSVGMLTHSFRSSDISMLIETNN